MMESQTKSRATCQEISQTRSDLPNPGTALVGCAGWSVSRQSAACFLEAGSQLQRYSSVLGAVEINSSFYRSHRSTTYLRWATSVPDAFRFSVKVPRLISHQLGLSGVAEPLALFVDETGALGEKLGCVLVQLPPSGEYVSSVATQFFALIRRKFRCMVACEARHPSWFGSEATAMLQAHAITRVHADPPKGEPRDFVPTTHSRYTRLHGSPRVYYSSYPDEFLNALRAQLSRVKHPAWVIFDNSASGSAVPNALSLRGGCAGKVALPQAST